MQLFSAMPIAGILYFFSQPYLAVLALLGALTGAVADLLTQAGIQLVPGEGAGLATGLMLRWGLTLAALIAVGLAVPGYSGILVFAGCLVGCRLIALILAPPLPATDRAS